MPRPSQESRPDGSWFILTGEITYWDPTTRALTLRDQPLVLAKRALTEPIVRGQRMRAKGYQDPKTGRR